MNKVILIGNLTRDPELRETSDGTAVCRFALAVNRRVGDKQEADFYNVTAWRNVGETIAKYAKKGNKMYILGNIALRDYEGQDGVKRTSCYVTVSDFEFLTPVKKDEEHPVSGEDSKPNNGESNSEGNKPKLEETNDNDSPF